MQLAGSKKAVSIKIVVKDRRKCNIAVKFEERKIARRRQLTRRGAFYSILF